MSSDRTQSTTKPRVQKISTLVSQLMSRKGYAQISSSDELTTSVEAAVGGQLGTAVRVGKIKKGILHLYAEDSVTLQELNFQKRKILKRIQNDLPQSNISDLRFRVLS